MVSRKIIKIDEDLCDGCGLCISACSEGALQIINGKAKLVKQSFCDGLGACVGNCPHNAIHVIEMEVGEYDKNGVLEYFQINIPEKFENHIKHKNENAQESNVMNTKSDKKLSQSIKETKFDKLEETPQKFVSQLRQWPVQLHLVPPDAPYFKNANLVLVADCVPIAYANFHSDFLSGNSIVIACPKLDNTKPYLQKLTQIIKFSSIKSLSVIIMEVPCCSGLYRLALEAISYADIEMNIQLKVVSLYGNLLN